MVDNPMRQPEVAPGCRVVSYHTSRNHFSETKSGRAKIGGDKSKRQQAADGANIGTKKGGSNIRVQRYWCFYNFSHLEQIMIYVSTVDYLSNLYIIPILNCGGA